ncbi:MAG: Unknown protein [uncultured Aureispira sp.]|uniref:Uncharacterized protein n=1 Tax=uncultured Aureispira sp. TaxID=1331704 RepID=A0A6S6S009_9BACT|nr:MAG: Unknown protein [uncultured Aureispira sp.]
MRYSVTNRKKIALKVRIRFKSASLEFSIYLKDSAFFEPRTRS